MVVASVKIFMDLRDLRDLSGASAIREISGVIATACAPPARNAGQREADLLRGQPGKAGDQQRISKTGHSPSGDVR